MAQLLQLLRNDLNPPRITRAPSSPSCPPPVRAGRGGMGTPGPYLVVQVGEGLLLPIQEDLAGRLLHSVEAHRVDGDIGGLGAGMEDVGGEDVLQEGVV